MNSIAQGNEHILNELLITLKPSCCYIRQETKNTGNETAASIKVNIEQNRKKR